MNEAFSPPARDNIYRIMIVDDSVTIRSLIARAFEGQPEFKVVATASNGELAIKSLQREPADVIVLDIEMPVMDGLTAIPQLKAIDPSVQIIMASTLTQKNAEISMKALSLGAADYIPKPTSAIEMAAASDFNRDLLEKAKVYGILARRKGVRRSLAAGEHAEPAKYTAPEPAKRPIVLRNEVITRPDVIAIGSSTGGPQALTEVIEALGKDLPQPVVITQHMPPTFTTILAEHIARQCNVTCHEGKNGEILKSSTYYLAPGDFHMQIVRTSEGPSIKLNKDPQENYCRPAVDPMLRSLVEVFGKRVLTIILTGMGRDGWKGSEAVVNAGGAILAQDEASSVVWGMPGAVANAGICTSVLPLHEIGAAVRKIAMKVRS